MVILVGGVNVIPADGDRFETLKLRHSEAPEVCMFEPNPALEADRKYNFEVITRVSVDVWVDALSYKYPQGNWEIKIHPTVPWEEHELAERSDYPQCNIMVVLYNLYICIYCCVLYFGMLYFFSNIYIYYRENRFKIQQK